MKKIRIGGKIIGDKEPCFVIAEAGVNHNGSLDQAKKLIDAAYAAKADAVKFQTFSAERIASRDAIKAEYQKETTDAAESQYAMLKRLELNLADFSTLAEYAKNKGILFLSSPFDRKSVDILEEIGIDAYKIPSGEITNIPLLKYIAHKEKPVILSTGMADLQEIQESFRVLKKGGADQIVLLHCVTSYPASLDVLNLRVMETLRKSFRVPVGFSDHTLGILAAVVARTLGACIIEKHFTLDKKLPGPDHKASLEPDELCRMVEAIRTVDITLGDGMKRISPEEMMIKRIARKSLVAGSDIPAGSIITAEMIEVKRPGDGIEPRYYEQVIGKKAKTRIRKDSLLSWEWLE
jgi:N-acetylneuraminate synthase